MHFLYRCVYLSAAASALAYCLYIPLALYFAASSRYCSAALRYGLQSMGVDCGALSETGAAEAAGAASPMTPAVTRPMAAVAMVRRIVFIFLLGQSQPFRAWHGCWG